MDSGISEFSSLNEIIAMQHFDIRSQSKPSKGTQGNPPNTGNVLIIRLDATPDLNPDCGTREKESEVGCEDAVEKVSKGTFSISKDTKRKKKKQKESLSKADCKSKSPKKPKTLGEGSYDSTELEESPSQVLDRFKRGCECQDDQCFKGLNPETVYRHRLNIAELTKAEHDMYLMGLTMACLTNPYETARHTERRRLRAQYVYQGRRVCLDAFLYLENCTHYQVKRIRKHLITHGVTPRVHGNHGKIPHNTFSLDIYQIATEFLKGFIEKQEAKQKTKAAKNAPLHLPSDITRKTVHDLYTDHCRKLSPNIKIMGYSTFRRFMKVQFPQVKFAKLEFIVRTNQNLQNSGNCNKNELDNVDGILEKGEEGLLPVVITSGSDCDKNAFLITPIDKIQDRFSYQVTTGGVLVNTEGIPLTIENVSRS